MRGLSSHPKPLAGTETFSAHGSSCAASSGLEIAPYRYRPPRPCGQRSQHQSPPIGARVRTPATCPLSAANVEFEAIISTTPTPGGHPAFPCCRGDPHWSIINAKSVNREITTSPPKVGKSSGDENEPYVISPGPQRWQAVADLRVQSTTHGESNAKKTLGCRNLFSGFGRFGGRSTIPAPQREDWPLAHD